MTPTPSPDTVEPTEADKALAEKLYLMEAPTFRAFADLIRQHVAAEVVRETAELRAHAKFLGNQLENVRIGMGWASIHATDHKSSPPPPNAV